MYNGHHRELGDHPSPFASGRATSGAAADAAAAVENDTAFPAADASEAGQSTSFAWAGAWEEVAEAPAIAAAYSSTLSAYAIAQQQVVVEPAEAEGLKAADVACALPGWRCEVVRLLALALPIAVTNLLGFASAAVGISFVGRLGGLQLSAAVLANSIFNVTGLSAMMGFTGTVDTLCGQAVGARNLRAVGLVLQRALLVNLCFGGAIAAAWWRSERLFLALGQEAELAAASARYLRILAPALPVMGTTEACKRWLMAQGVVQPATVAAAASATLSPLWNWLYIVRLGLGLDGAALAVLSLQCTSLALVGGYTLVRNISSLGQEQAVWHGWSREAFREWGGYLALALPSVVMICCKWWAFEFLLIMAGWFKDAQLAVATMGVLQLSSSIAFALFFGISMAGSIRISQALGAGCPKVARRATWAGLGLTLTIVTCLLTSLLLLQGRWVRLFTTVGPVVDAAVALLPIFAATLLGDATYTALMALLRGAGKQKWGALSNIVSYWLLAIPLAHHLAFARDWGLPGLWVGAATANAFQAALMAVLALRFDYAGAAAAAVARYALRQPLLFGEEQA
ncbi:hypothetical protein ABPG77_001613 [Micractinium sp. CCAP 211/92]